MESLSDSVLESESSTSLSGTPSLLKRKSSISSSRGKREDAAPSSTAAAWGGTCGRGIANGGGSVGLVIQLEEGRVRQGNLVLIR